MILDAKERGWNIRHMKRWRLRALPLTFVTGYEYKNAALVNPGIATYDLTTQTVGGTNTYVSNGFQWGIEPRQQSPIHIQKKLTYRWPNAGLKVDYGNDDLETKDNNHMYFMSSSDSLDAPGHPEHNPLRILQWRVWFTDD